MKDVYDGEPRDAMIDLIALVDRIQAEDMGEFEEIPSVLKPGATLVTQLSMRFKNQTPEILPTSDREVLLQTQATRLSCTEVCGRVVDSTSEFFHPNEYLPEGVTSLEVLVIAKEVPISLDYLWFGRVDVQRPRKGEYILVSGLLRCEPSFSKRFFFCPVSARVEESTRWSGHISPDEDRDLWTSLRLRLTPNLSNPQYRVSNLGIGDKSGRFYKVSMYNPPTDGREYLLADG
jgi:hypothetical protein